MNPKKNQGETMIEVYVAKNIVTMNPSLPEATAIAIRDGEILEVGKIGRAHV